MHHVGYTDIFQGPQVEFYFNPGSGDQPYQGMTWRFITNPPGIPVRSVICLKKKSKNQPKPKQNNMTGTNIAAFGKKLDLILERVIDVPRDQVWRTLVEPELVKRWFSPAPWKIIDCKIDLRAGGIFHTLMQGPGGEQRRGHRLLPGNYPKRTHYMDGGTSP